MKTTKVKKKKKKEMGEEEGELFLVDWHPSLFAARVRIALAEKELKYESKQEDILNKSSLLLQINPVYKLVPVLIHNGKPICESVNIVQYIDEVWNHKSPLLPSDPYQKALAMFWADYIDKKIIESGRTLVWAQEEKVKEKSKEELIEGLKVLEEEIGEKLYFGGERFGYVDLVLIPLYSSFYTFEKMGNLNMEVECPKLVEWANRCMLKDSVSQSLCNQLKVYEVVLELRKKFGIHQ